MKAVKIIELERNILEKEVERNMSLIENEKYRLAEKNKADVQKYAKVQAAEANSHYLTDNYIRLKSAEYFSKNAKLYFSGKNTPLGKFFEKITQEL